LRVLRNNAAHEQNYALESQSIQANITDLARRSVARRRIACHSSQHSYFILLNSDF
jgi:hypothetical protein